MVSLMVCLLNGCDGRYAPAAPLALDWQFNPDGTFPVADAGWPSEPGATAGGVWLVETPGTIRLTLPSGMVIETPYHDLQVFRKGPNIRCVSILLDGERPDNAYVKVKKWAAQLGITRLKNIEEWNARRKNPNRSGNVGVFAAVQEGVEGRQVSIGTNYGDRARSVFIRIDADINLARATTQVK